MADDERTAYSPEVTPKSTASSAPSPPAVPSKRSLASLASPSLASPSLSSPSLAAPSPTSPSLEKTSARSQVLTHASPYHAFCKEQRPSLPPGLNNAEREAFLGQRWKALADSEKARYKVGGAVPRTPFQVFCKEQRPLLPPYLRNAAREKRLGQLWRALDAAEKSRYQEDSLAMEHLDGQTVLTTTSPSTPAGPSFEFRDQDMEGRSRVKRGKGKAKGGDASAASTAMPTATSPVSPASRAQSTPPTLTILPTARTSAAVTPAESYDGEPSAWHQRGYGQQRLYGQQPPRQQMTGMAGMAELPWLPSVPALSALPTAPAMPAMPGGGLISSTSDHFGAVVPGSLVEQALANVLEYFE
eukprot:CAMPEP_0119075796 /NCGR_PEP_ID=MMETSP1178-20130426/83390_1 /TAXON_ID=33656 /ORGANISM="unid sp, Strain CCMP2000" /LENGTH=357 /DNA_ID=CAMNT_0007058037 /DNA_START=173 /DNA_END=1246 /DNA_ORIENTATION=+